MGLYSADVLLRNCSLSEPLTRMLNVYNLVVFVHRQLDEFTYIFRCIGVDLQMYMLNCVIIFCRFK